MLDLVDRGYANLVGLVPKDPATLDELGKMIDESNWVINKIKLTITAYRLSK